MKVPYDTSWLPAAPFLPVRLASLAEQSETIAVQAKLDTGADLAAVPYALIERLQLVPAGEIEVEGYNSRRETMRAYDVNLQVDQLNANGLLVIGFAEDYVLLGRDVLKRLRLLLDGPALTAEILTP
jgi:hypothetical protein